MNDKIVYIGGAAIVALMVAIVVRDNRDINEIPAYLYPENEYNWGENNVAVKRPCELSLNSVQEYWKNAKEIPLPNMVKFMEYAAHSSNGLDSADCRMIEKIYWNHKSKEDSIEWNMEVQSFIDAPRR